MDDDNCENNDHDDCTNGPCITELHVPGTTGLKITAGHRTMSGQDDYYFVRTTFGFGGHFDQSCTRFPNN